MIRAIAIDDEPIALDVLSVHAGSIPFLDLRRLFTSPLEAIAYLQHNPVDLIFLDIRMPDIPGTELAALVPKNVHIVFTTAYSEYAVKGFELAAADYLLKPISANRLLKACRLVEAKIAGRNPKPESDSLFVKDGYRMVKIDLDDVCYVEAGDNYISIYQKEKRTLTRMTLTEFLAKLPAERFQRTHKSYIVSISKIEKYEAGRLHVNGIQIPVSASYKSDLLLKLNPSLS